MNFFCTRVAFFQNRRSRYSIGACATEWQLQEGLLLYYR